MKYIVVLLALLSSLFTFSQRQPGQSGIDISKSEYVAVKYQDIDKLGTAKSGVRFINTATGKINDIKLASNATVQHLEHIIIEALGIDLVVIVTEENIFKTSNTEYSLMIFNKIGELKKLINLDKLKVTDYIINRKSGRIVLLVLENSVENLLNQKQGERIFDLRSFEEILSK